jgi:hypothetical protein
VNDWLADIAPLAKLPNGKLAIEPSRAGGVRVHVYWHGGGADELAVAVRVIQGVEARLVPLDEQALRERRG